MSGRLLVFGGTTEGRSLLERGIPALCCVATDYGAKLLARLPLVETRVGRLNQTEMEELFRREGITHVIDATHPYAVEATKNISAACSRADVKLLRIARPRTVFPEGTVVVSGVDEAARLLDESDENVLLTVGSKELPRFAVVKNAAARLYARVLPSAAVLAQCEALGFDAGHIIAMRGPFTQAMNELMLAAVGAKTLVTKDSGEAGGLSAKFAAAARAGARVVVIARPQENGVSVEEAVLWARRELGLESPPLFPMLISLEGRTALLTGGGPVALRRAHTLLRCGARVKVVAPDFCEGWEEVACEKIVRGWQPGDLDGVALAVAATGSREENSRAAAEARRRGVPVSVADNAAEGTFCFPSLVSCGTAAVTVSTAGLDPALTRRLADRLRRIWPSIVAEVTEEERQKKEELPR